MTETMLIEQKDLRNEYINRIEVLDKVKSLFLIPKLEVMTTKQVADYYEVNIEAIQKCYQRNKDEIDSDGTTFKKPSDFRVDNMSKLKSDKRGTSKFQLDDGTIIEIQNYGIKCFSKRAILRIGMLLRDSKIAQEVRTQLLNTFEHATEIQRTQEIINEQDLYVKFAKAAIEGSKEDLLYAAQEVFTYKNRHITELSQTITANKPKVEFAEAMVGNVNSTISIGDMAKLLHKNGYKIGQNRLFVFLRKIKAIDGNNVAYQKYINNGYFKLSEKIITKCRPPKVVTKTLVTPKGQVFIHNKVKQHYEEIMQK